MSHTSALRTPILSPQSKTSCMAIPASLRCALSPSLPIVRSRSETSEIGISSFA